MGSSRDLAGDAHGPERIRVGAARQERAATGTPIVTNQKQILRVWLAVAVLTAVIVVPLWRPMQVAWRCYRLHRDGARAEAELVSKLGSGKLVLQLHGGSQAGHACTAGASAAVFDASEVGDVLEVVYFEARPGDCVLVSTVENSGLLLWALTGGVAGLLLLVVAGGLTLHHSFAMPRHPARRMALAAAAPHCPVCAAPMAEGYLPLLAGVHWREPGAPIGLPHALSGLPGTLGWRNRPALHAFRCAACEIVSFQYGHPAGTDPRSRAAG
jgi:hypothetical protein